MSQNDQIAVTIPEADLAEIQAAVATLRGKLLPHLTSLDSRERLELPKMGDKTVAFVQKAMEYAKNNGDLVPPYLDFPAMEIDVKAVETLRQLAQTLGPIDDALNDSIMLSGSEAYQAALVFYSAVKNAAKGKAPNAGSIYEDLSRRFPGKAGAKKVTA